MNNKTIDILDRIEDRIENIKWLITTPFFFTKTNPSSTINLIRKSAGILGKSFPAGIIAENKIRKAWKSNLLKRTA